jgi:hypothetical protein
MCYVHVNVPQKLAKMEDQQERLQELRQALSAGTMRQATLASLRSEE